LIRHAHGKHGYTLKEIAQALGVHYTTISKVINRNNLIFQDLPP
jgi:REP-associated tyrosine transposase